MNVIYYLASELKRFKKCNNELGNVNQEGIKGINIPNVIYYLSFELKGFKISDNELGNVNQA